MTKSLWAIRILFLTMCAITGYAVSQTPELPIPFMDPETPVGGIVIGFGFGMILVAIDEMLKGFSLRAFSAATFGLVLGTMIAAMIDGSGMFDFVETQGDEKVRWIVRLCLFIGFSYIGMVLAMRSNKEDISLIIPYVRFSSRHQPDDLLLLDTSAIIDGRVADLIETRFLEGIVIVPRFVLKELQNIADSKDPLRRDRGRRGLDVLSRVQKLEGNEFRIHEGDVSDESEVDAKLIYLARAMGAKLFTTDYNLGKLAEVQSVSCVNISKMAEALKPVVLPGERFPITIVRKGKDKDQGVGYMNDGTMVVVNLASERVNESVDVVVSNRVQTNAGVIIFADLAD
jgi:uncharacterized protein YacL